MMKKQSQKLPNFFTGNALKLIVLVVILLGSIHTKLYAQVSADKAKAYYFSAVEQYDNRNYSKAIEYCQQVEDLLGSTNARVEAVRLKSYFGKGNIKKAKESLNLFLTLGADDNLLKEIAPYITKIDEAEERVRKQEEARIQKEKAAQEQKEAAANAKQEAIQKAIAEGGFDKNGLKKVEYRTYSGFESIDNEGFIDETGKEVIPIINHYVHYLNAYAKEYIWAANHKEKLYGLYDIQGNVILPMGHYSYDNGWPPFDNNGFGLGLLAVKKNGKWGYVNKAGEVVIPFRFESAGTFKLSQKSVFTKNKKHTYVRNAAYVWIGRDNFYINTNGERISN